MNGGKAALSVTEVAVVANELRRSRVHKSHVVSDFICKEAIELVMRAHLAEIPTLRICLTNQLWVVRIRGLRITKLKLGLVVVCEAAISYCFACILVVLGVTQAIARLHTHLAIRIVLANVEPATVSVRVGRILLHTHTLRTSHVAEMTVKAVLLAIPILFLRATGTLVAHDNGRGGTITLRLCSHRLADQLCER